MIENTSVIITVIKLSIFTMQPSFLYNFRSAFAAGAELADW